MTPLSRVAASPAERITLPLYAIAYILMGGLFVFQDSARTGGSAFAVARIVGDWLSPGEFDGIALWGLVFTAVGVVEGVALLCHLSPRVYIAALSMGAGLSAFWTVALAASAIRAPDVSFTGAVWLGVVVCLQVASARGLARRHAPLPIEVA